MTGRVIFEIIIASYVTFGFGSNEVGRIGVDVELHVAGVEAEGYRGVCGNIVKEAATFSIDSFGGLRLEHSNVVQTRKNSIIENSTIIEYSSND